MRQIVDEQLLEEAGTYRLRAACEHCAHFEERTQTCAEGYPNADHRLRTLRLGDEFVFCKEFELC